MKKVSPSFFKGIVFIRLSSLPLFQQEELMEWLPPTSMINISVGGNALEDCLLYTDYEYWFDNFYAESAIEMQEI